MAISLLLGFVGELRRYDGTGRATVNLTLAVFAIAYVGGLIGFLVQLRLFGGGDGRLGMMAIVSLIAIVKMSDIGQYTAGRLFGRHKLAPTVSPGKTWEGLIGGVVFASATAWLLIEPSISRDWLSGGGLIHAATYGIALAVAGLVGDLAESLLKRDAGREGLQRLDAGVRRRARSVGFAVGGGAGGLLVLGAGLGGTVTWTKARVGAEHAPPLIKAVDRRC